MNLSKQALIAIFFVLGLLIYANSFSTSFQFDDESYIVNNYPLHDLSGFLNGKFLTAQIPRFIGLLTLALNYHFHKLDVFGYHAVNLIIHVTASLLVVWLVSLLMMAQKERSSQAGKYDKSIAYLTGLFFLCHPLQTQAVTYITQRFTSLATLFYLLSLCLYLKARIEKLRGAEAGLILLLSACVGIMGMLTKQIVLTLPLMIMAIEYLLFSEGRSRQEKLRSLSWGRILFLIPFLLVIPAIYSFRLFPIFSIRSPSMSHVGDIITSFKYFITQWQVIIVYLRLLIFPFGQNLDYDFPLAAGLSDPLTLVCLGVHLGLIYLALKLSTRDPLISLGLLWFYITLLIESSIIPIAHVIFEHRVYLPSVGFFLIFSILLARSIKNNKTYLAIVGTMTVALCLLTVQRNKVWHDPVSLWSDVTLKSPQKPRGYVNLGKAYLEKGEYIPALTNFSRAIALHKDYAEAYNFRGVVFSSLGSAQEAIADFDQATAIDKDFVAAYVNRANIYRKVGRGEEALRDYNYAVHLQPQHAGALLNRGNYFGSRKEYDLAIQDFSRVIILNPYLEEAYKNRGDAYLLSHRPKEALTDYAKAIDLDPKDAQLFYQRSLAYFELKEYADALKDALLAAQLGKDVNVQYVNRLKGLIRE